LVFRLKSDIHKVEVKKVDYGMSLLVFYYPKALKKRVRIQYSVSRIDKFDIVIINLVNVPAIPYVYV